MCLPVAHRENPTASPVRLQEKEQVFDSMSDKRVLIVNNKPKDAPPGDQKTLFPLPPDGSRRVEIVVELR